MSTAKVVRAAIRKLPRGRPFTGAHFLKLGTRGAVDRTLSRLAADGEIWRLAYGVFVRPKISRFVGAVVPDLQEVVEAIARRNGETVQIHGAEAARRFRLTTQVPTGPVFHTSGSTRTIRVAGTAVTYGPHREPSPAAIRGRADRRRDLRAVVSRKGQCDSGDRSPPSKAALSPGRNSRSCAPPTCRPGWRRRSLAPPGKPRSTAGLESRSPIGQSLREAGTAPAGRPLGRHPLRSRPAGSRIKHPVP